MFFHVAFEVKLGCLWRHPAHTLRHLLYDRVTLPCELFIPYTVFLRLTLNFLVRSKPFNCILFSTIIFTSFRSSGGRQRWTCPETWTGQRPETGQVRVRRPSRNRARPRSWRRRSAAAFLSGKSRKLRSGPKGCCRWRHWCRLKHLTSIALPAIV